MTTSDLAAAPSRLQAVTAAWKTVLVHVEAGPQGGAQLGPAVALAEDLDALLVGVAAEAVEPMAYSEPYLAGAGPFYVALQEQISADLQAAEKTFRTKAANTRHAFHALEARPVPTLAALARSCDVIVAGAGAPADSSYLRAAAAELALSAGRPVLVAPAGSARLRAETVVVAWKDTRESRRALADALPVLKSARDVLVVAVCDKDGAEGGEIEVQDVVLGLKRHGVKARSKVVVASDARVAEILNGEAAGIGADLIVAGCYGRARLNEWLFGGATRDLLHAPERFLLISH
jgi:nucleotide-binding universal stress UspA family protein